jgi:hypothetical protein
MPQSTTLGMVSTVHTGKCSATCFRKPARLPPPIERALPHARRVAKCSGHATLNSIQAAGVGIIPSSSDSAGACFLCVALCKEESGRHKDGLVGAVAHMCGQPLRTCRVGSTRGWLHSPAPRHEPPAVDTVQTHMAAWELQECTQRRPKPIIHVCSLAGIELAALLQHGVGQLIRHGRRRGLGALTGLCRALLRGLTCTVCKSSGDTGNARGTLSAFIPALQDLAAAVQETRPNTGRLIHHLV